MPIPYYDISPLTPDEQGWLDIERVYCFDWDAFDAGLFERLRKLLASLSNYCRHGTDDCHWWFSDRYDAEDGYLTAGVEPPGLHVYGDLPASSWNEWDRTFQKATDGLPLRDLS